MSLSLFTLLLSWYLGSELRALGLDPYSLSYLIGVYHVFNLVL